jgi:hypothetical protein
MQRMRNSIQRSWRGPSPRHDLSKLLDTKYISSVVFDDWVTVCLVPFDYPFPDLPASQIKRIGNDFREQFVGLTDLSGSSCNITHHSFHHFADKHTGRKTLKSMLPDITVSIAPNIDVLRLMSESIGEAIVHNQAVISAKHALWQPMS